MIFQVANVYHIAPAGGRLIMKTYSIRLFQNLNVAMATSDRDAWLVFLNLPDF